MKTSKTKFVIAVTQRLSTAPDSDAKFDLIEELSENLYGRFRDMVSGGMSEDEAFQRALSELGDVDELLACLGMEQGADAGEPARGAQEPPAEDDWFQSFKGIMRQATDQARQAMEQARQAASDAAEMVQREVQRGLDGVEAEISVEPGKGAFLLHTDDFDGDMEFPSGGLRGIRVNFPGDLTVFQDTDPNAPVWLRGDIHDLQVSSEDGVLTVTRNKAAGGFSFLRAAANTSVELTIPLRFWDRLEITTASGDVEISDGMLEADSVILKTASGDIQLYSLSARRLEVTTASGDLELSDCVIDEAVFHSASGDLEGMNVSAAVLAQTASGDVELTGSIRALRADTASGDVELHADILPDALELSTKSGDCEVYIPDVLGFTLNYATVSGSLFSSFPLTTTGRMGGGGGERHAGVAVYLDGGDRQFSVSSISGDIALRKS